jgi:phosphatidate cytidylyltransferase
MLAQRVATAALLVVGFLLALFLLPPSGWTLLAAAILAVGAWEWAGFAHLTPGARTAYAGVMTIAGLLAALALGLVAGRVGSFEGLLPVYALAAVFWLAGAPLWLSRAPWAAPRGLVLLAGWIVLVPTFLALVQLRNIHPFTLLGFMMLVWIADIAAFFAGRRFGRRKLAPRVSPGKTWEGAYGALAGTAAYGLAWTFLAREHAPSLVRDLPLPALGMLVLAAGLAALSIVGDLFESAMKRQAGLKDSGRILPGHGGVMDRIDALTPVLPIAAMVSILA